MITLINPEKIVPLEDQNKLGKGWNYVLDYSWIDSQIADYVKDKKNFVCLDVGCGKSKLGDYFHDKYNLLLFKTDRRKLKGINFVGNFLELDFDFTPDIIYWASSIEHNSILDLEKCYKKSMDMLMPEGLFLATFAVSMYTHQFQPAKQVNLSMEDALKIFNEKEFVNNNYFGIWELYRKNIFELRDKYEKRFKKFSHGDPEYIVGAVRKIA